MAPLTTRHTVASKRHWFLGAIRVILSHSVRLPYDFPSKPITLKFASSLEWIVALFRHNQTISSWANWSLSCGFSLEMRCFLAGARVTNPVHLRRRKTVKWVNRDNVPPGYSTISPAISVQVEKMIPYAKICHSTGFFLGCFWWTTGFWPSFNACT